MAHAGHTMQDTRAKQSLPTPRYGTKPKSHRMVIFVLVVRESKPHCYVLSEKERREKIRQDDATILLSLVSLGSARCAEPHRH